MKYFYLALCICFLTVTAASQKLNRAEEYPFNFYKLNNLQLHLSAESVSIFDGQESLFNKEIKGTKLLKASPSKNYFFIGNFLFEEEKDVQFEISVFNDEGILQFTHENIIGFDLPVPLFTLNNNGQLFSYDPLTYTMEIIEAQKRDAVQFLEGAEFELERSAYLEADNEFAFVLTSNKPLSIENEENDVHLYKVNISNLSFDKRELHLTIPSLLKIINEDLIISGVKFNNSSPHGSTFIYDKNINLNNSVPIPAEKIISFEDGYLVKNENSLLKLDENFSTVQTINFENKWIKDFVIYNNGIAVFLFEGEKKIIAGLNSSLAVEFEEELNILEPENFINMEINEGNIFLHFSNQTIILK
jgi:hypothetical protein